MRPISFHVLGLMLVNFQRLSSNSCSSRMRGKLFDAVLSMTPRLCIMKESVSGLQAGISLNMSWVAAVHFPLCRYVNCWKGACGICCPDMWNWCLYCCSVHQHLYCWAQSHPPFSNLSKNEGWVHLCDGVEVSVGRVIRTDAMRLVWWFLFLSIRIVFETPMHSLVPQILDYLEA
ncbi:hypothetical protein MANES_14G068850v8 [Manihot esculenta]|uniref:Uncharacterized protein n=1 Tax=Manihot esculenta TaxID=3983 RepID=A0ACB7GJA9_MANES|nr:hypothetical protein MANES_14G068850v8 [Manihot esculenta]